MYNLRAAIAKVSILDAALVAQKCFIANISALVEPFYGHIHVAHVIHTNGQQQADDRFSIPQIQNMDDTLC